MALRLFHKYFLAMAKYTYLAETRRHILSIRNHSVCLQFSGFARLSDRTCQPDSKKPQRGRRGLLALDRGSIGRGRTFVRTDSLSDHATRCFFGWRAQAGSQSP